MAAYSTVKSIANNWIIKGNVETNEFNKFICYWISFNCFYNHRTNSSGDRTAINKLINDSNVTMSYNGAITTETQSLLYNLKNVCPVYNLKNPSQGVNITDTSNFAQVVNVIYQIRCNLFHGGKGETDVRDLLVINAATPVLEFVVKTLVEVYLP
ncbi:MAG TPA: hypothetical protein VKG26_09310 [Bacteroidia bacterium]|nr:hypothetical protein [Bacteroidia bacterium]